MKTILFIVGSMRKTSFNKELAEETKKIIGDRAQVSFLNYSDIPYMNQDLEKDLPESIVKVKECVGESDALWIFTPEYNGMIPGVLKNLLDWLSRSYVPGDFSSGTPVKGKPVTFTGAGGANMTKSSREQLGILLKRIGMKVMDDPSYGFRVPPESMQSDHWELTQEDINDLKDQADAFLKFIEE